MKTTNADGTFSTASFEDLIYKSIVRDEEGNAALSQYDAYGRLLYSQAQKGGAYYTVQSYSYDEVGQVTSVQDALNNFTNHYYDALGQLTSVKNANQETTAYQYDLFGNLTTTIYPGGSKLQKQYDELGRLKTQTDPSGKIRKVFYDANGNMNRFEDRKGTAFTYVYDTRNRMITRTSPSETIAYTYTLDGQRKTMTDQTGTTTYTYDANTGQLTNQKYPDNKTISHTYDGHGKMLTTSGPFARTTTYGYDNVNRLKTVSTDTNLNATYSYLKNDVISKIEGANGINSEFTYDGLKMTQLQHKKTSGTVINKYEYTHDLTGNIVNRKENGESTTFSYGTLGRIQTNSQFNEAYEYDSKGNRSALTSEALPEFTDATYEYDDWNRLTKVTTFEGVITYKYNGDDRLVERTENGETIRYYWSNDRIVAEGKVIGGVVSEKASYVYGVGLLERINGSDGSRSSYLLNGHGDVVEMRDMQGIVQNQYTYDIWGKPLQETESVDNPFRYSGEYWDDSVNLQYLRARWYDPSTARFINEDTYEGELTNPLSQNLYTYVVNNPLLYTDPSGNQHIIDGSVSTPKGNLIYLDKLSQLELTDIIMNPYESPAVVQAAVDEFVRRNFLVVENGVLKVAEGVKIFVKSMKNILVNTHKATQNVVKTTKVTNLLLIMPEFTGSTRDRLLSAVQNKELSKIVDQLYRPGATFGDGGTASILTKEFYEGSSTHLLKAKQRLSQLNNLAKSGKLGLNDLDILDALRDDLENAISLFK